MEEVISERSAEEIELQKGYFERLTNMSECGLAVVKMQTDPEILYANDYFYRILQYTREEVVEKYQNRIMGPVLPEEQQKVKALIARQVSMGGNIHYECRAARKDGSIVWLSITAKREEELGSMVYYCSCIDISQSKRHLEDVYNAKREVDLIANSIPGGVIKVRMSDFHILYANDGFFRLAGYSRSEYNTRFHNDCTTQIHPDDLEEVKKTARQSVKNMGPLGTEYRIVTKSGDVRWSYVNGTRIDDQDGQVVYLCVVVDITSRKQAEQELADNNHRSSVITGMLNETIWTFDLESKTLRREGNLDWTYSPEAVLERSFTEETIRSFLHPEDADRFLAMRDSWFDTLGEQRDTFRVLNRAGAYRLVEVITSSESRTGGDKPEVVYGLTRLLTQQEEKSALIPEIDVEEVEADNNKISGKLTKMAGTAQASTEDTITGLLPYAGFLRKAENVLASRKPEEQYALVCADINEFRSFSHHYGFYISNRILKAFSDVLLQYLAKDGMCARVDGDYFVVLFQYASHKELVKAMSSVVRHQQEMESDEDNIEFGSTVGVYLVQEEDHELMGMLEKADLARRSIKGLKGNHYAIYTEDVAKQLSTEDEMVEAVRNAMTNHRVEVNYLPRIQDAKDNVVGCKAIPRILTDDGEYIEYVQIMHLMERVAQLEEFSFYLLQEVANNLGAYQSKGNTIIPISVEMTASQLSTINAVERIHNMVVTQNGLDPRKFIFEIPERFFVDATTAFEMAIRRLYNLGYQIVISRFASDHVAINSIRRLPVTGIKFHGEYFQEHMINEKDKIILKKVVEMAEELGLTVTCGGIHTRLQEEFARSIGCKVFEGDMYYGVMKNVVFERCFLESRQENKSE